jgi:hypothetical protein
MALPHIPHLVHLTHPDQVESLLVPTSPTDNTKPCILMIVGAIPSFAPITREERMVYTTVSSILTIPYDPNVGVDAGEDGELPVPIKRLFLEMPYKPRITPMVHNIYSTSLRSSDSFVSLSIHLRVVAPSSNCPWLAPNNWYRSHDRARTRTAADVGPWGC